MIRFFKGPTWADRRIVAFDRGEPGDRYKCLAVVRQRGLGVILFNAVFVGFMVEDKEFLDGQCYAHERRGEAHGRAPFGIPAGRGAFEHPGAIGGVQRKEQVLSAGRRAPTLLAIDREKGRG